MATVGGWGFSGVDHLNTFFESGNNYLWNSWAADDALDRSKELTQYQYGLQKDLSKELTSYQADLGYDYYLRSLRESPQNMVSGLESAGLNPILAANSSAGSYSPQTLNASVGSNGLSFHGDSGHSGSSSAPSSPMAFSRERLGLAQQRAAIDQATSSADAQKNLANLYATQADRNRYMPITESDNGGISILGSGFNSGGTDTLIFDTKTGQLIRPKDAKSANSAKSKGTVEVLFDYDKNKASDDVKERSKADPSSILESMYK